MNEQLDLMDEETLRRISVVGRHEASLRERYREAVRRCYDPARARVRFAEYDAFREVWTSELWRWLFGDNVREVYSLTQFAWAVQHDRLSEGGVKAVCLNWSEKNQRLYLGDGLLEYLGLLKDEVEAVFGEGEGGEV